MAMTSDEKIKKLLKEIKVYLGITWNDVGTDSKITSFIKSGISRLNTVAGIDLDFCLEDEEEKNANKQSLNNIARDLLFARCFYANEKALDDFERNYSNEFLSLWRLAEIYKEELKQNAKQ